MNNNLNSFLLSANLNISEDKIKEFFKSNNINIQSIRAKEQSDKITYEISYESNAKTIFILEDIKTKKQYDKNDFVIIKLSTGTAYHEIYKKLLNDFMSSNEIVYPIKYEDSVRINFMKTYDAPGVEFINHEVIEKQRGVLSYMVKKFGTNIFTGQGIQNMSLPIHIFDPRSTLEAFAFNYKLSPNYLDKIGDASNLERLKLITTYFLSVINTMMQGGKPFNPILGETFQAKIGDSLVYCEQTSHHPPIYNFYVKNPNFIVYGYNQMDINSGAKAMTFRNKGKYFLKTNDGNIYSVHFPQCNIMGLMIGNRYINFSHSMMIEDNNNELVSVLNFSDPEKSFLGKMFSSKSKKFPDNFSGFITKKDELIEKKGHYYPKEKNNVFATFEGEWTYNINIDGVDYWKQGEAKFYPSERMEYTLPSDSSYRPDIHLLRAGYDDYAQIAKTELEELQRYEKKLRDDYRKSKK